MTKLLIFFLIAVHCTYLTKISIDFLVENAHIWCVQSTRALLLPPGVLRPPDPLHGRPPGGRLRRGQGRQSA